MAISHSLRQHHKRVAQCIGAPLKNGEHRVIVTPAFNIPKDSDTGEDYGNKGIVIIFAIRQDWLIASTGFLTDYYGQPKPYTVTHHVDYPLCTGVYMHILSKKRAPIGAKEHNCFFTRTRTCYDIGHGSYGNGDKLTTQLIERGEAGVWAELKEYINKNYGR